MEPVVYGTYYHVLNQGVAGQNIFRYKKDYQRFFELMTIFIEPVANVYAYAAMKNHFHLALWIKKEADIGYLNPKHARSKELDLKWKTYSLETLLQHNQDKQSAKNLRSCTSGAQRSVETYKKPVPDKMIQHFCSAYAKAFNTRYQRKGALLQHPYKRIPVHTANHLRRLILYIHNNPIKHHFCTHPADYPWTSYLSLISIKPTQLARENVLGYFDNQARFKAAHQPTDDFKDIEHLFLE